MTKSNALSQTPLGSLQRSQLDLNGTNSKHGGIAGGEKGTCPSYWNMGSPTGIGSGIRVGLVNILLTGMKAKHNNVQGRILIRFESWKEYGGGVPTPSIRLF